jgi:aminocarboxymuconate-semialdehyde decarboxylase
MSGNRHPTVDIHAHVFTPACLQLVDGLMAPEMDPFSYFGGPETNAYQAGHVKSIMPRLTDPAVRIADMDRMGIDVQALSVAPPQYYYWTDPELGRRLARMQNEHLAEIVAGNQDRFVGLATVPMQDVSSAVAELDHAVGELGFRGVEINTNVVGLDLDDRRYRPFFAKAEELDIVVLVHPNGFTHGQRLTKYYMTNVVGNPLDTTVALARIIHGGVLEDHPGLNLCFVHGGGYLPFYSSRMDHAYEQRPEGRHHISRPPSSYLRQVFVDCLVFDEIHLEFLLRKMGPDHVVVGTDYPFDMGHYDPLGQIDKVAGLSGEERQMVRGGTAARLLKLEP